MNSCGSIISREFSLCRIYRKYYFYSFLNFRLSLGCLKDCINRYITLIGSFRIECKSGYSEGLSVCIPTSRLFSFYLPAYELITVCCFYFRYKILLCGILINGIMNRSRSVISREFSFFRIYREYNFDSLLNFFYLLNINCYPVFFISFVKNQIRLFYSHIAFRCFYRCCSKGECSISCRVCLKYMS